MGGGGGGWERGSGDRILAPTNFPQHMYSQNYQRHMGIILSHICCPRFLGSAQLTLIRPPLSHAPGSPRFLWVVGTAPITGALKRGQLVQERGSNDPAPPARNPFLFHPYAVLTVPFHCILQSSTEPPYPGPPLEIPPPPEGRPSLHCFARQYLLQWFLFPICHTHVLALLSHRFKLVTCVCSVTQKVFAAPLDTARSFLGCFFTHVWLIFSVAETGWLQGFTYNNGGLHSILLTIAMVVVAAHTPCRGGGVELKETSSARPTTEEGTPHGCPNLRSIHFDTFRVSTSQGAHSCEGGGSMVGSDRLNVPAIDNSSN